MRNLNWVEQYITYLDPHPQQKNTCKQTQYSASYEGRMKPNLLNREDLKAHILLEVFEVFVVPLDMPLPHCQSPSVPQDHRPGHAQR